MRDLWQSQPVDSQPWPVEELRRRSLAWESAVRRRNTREYAAALFVALCCSLILLFATPWHIRAGAVLTLAGLTTVCFNIHRKGAAPLPSDAATPSRDWYRAELTRQRDLLRGVWKWYLGPQIPGLSMWLAGGLWDHPERWPRVLPVCAIAAAIFIVIGNLNARTARNLDKEIASL